MCEGAQVWACDGVQNNQHKHLRSSVTGIPVHTATSMSCPFDYVKRLVHSCLLPIVCREGWTHCGRCHWHWICRQYMPAHLPHPSVPWPAPPPTPPHPTPHPTPMHSLTSPVTHVALGTGHSCSLSYIITQWPSNVPACQPRWCCRSSWPSSLQGRTGTKTSKPLEYCQGHCGLPPSTDIN